MTKAYKIVMYGCGAGSAAITLMYVAVAMLAIGDGADQGVEIPREMNALIMITVLFGGLLSGGAWVVDRANRASVTRDVQPLIRAEVERAMLGIVPDMAWAVANHINEKIDASNARTATRIHEIITVDINEILNAAIGRAHRAGLVQQAQGQAGARVRHLRMTMTSADE